MSGKLSAKQAAFAREYLVDLNATAAYRRAGYTARGNSAESSASQLLRNPKVAAEIAFGQQKRAERTQVDSDWVLRRLADEAGADLADLYDESGQLKSVHDWPKVWRTGLVAGIETVQERDGADAEGNPVYVTVRKVKLADRVRMVELIGKHVNVGAFKEKLELSGNVGIAEALSAAKQRMDGEG